MREAREREKDGENEGVEEKGEGGNQCPATITIDLKNPVDNFHAGTHAKPGKAATVTARAHIRSTAPDPDLPS